MNRNLLLIGAALLLGAVAAFLMWHFIEGKVAELDANGKGKTTTVAVPGHDLHRGDVLKADDLLARPIPKNLSSPNMLTPQNFGQYVGQTLTADAPKGVPMTSGMLQPSYDHFSSVIAEDKVAFTLPVDDVNSISGLIVPGDHVDVLLLPDDQGGGSRIVPLLNNLLVLATGGVSRAQVQSHADQATFSNLTLELTPDQAERAALAQKTGQLFVALRNATNTQPLDYAMLDRAQLLSMGAPSPLPKAIRSAPDDYVQMIIGGQ